MSVPSLIITHDYYNLALIPIVALALAPLGHLFLKRIAQESKLSQAAFLLVAVLAIAYPAWIARNEMVAVDYRQEILGWKKIGKQMPKEARLIGITHDYNARINYYGWVGVVQWPHTADIEMNNIAGGNNDPNDPAWKKTFDTMTAGFDYFIVTEYPELETQPVLKQLLYQHPHFDGEGYTLFDLRIVK